MSKRENHFHNNKCLDYRNTIISLFKYSSVRKVNIFCCDSTQSKWIEKLKIDIKHCGIQTSITFKERFLTRKENLHKMLISTKLFKIAWKGGNIGQILGYFYKQAQICPHLDANMYTFAYIF